jgi:predicted MPP superfamily phosphohydrolase
MRALKLLFLIFATCAVAIGALLLWMYCEARRDPVVRTATIVMPNWPKGAKPVRVVLLSDVHAGTRAGPPARLKRIVAGINVLKPDLVVMAGDFTPGHHPIGPHRVAEILAPLTQLRARLGVIAVPGNHDHWTGMPAVRATLESGGAIWLANQAIMRGPLAIGGIDDDFTRRADAPAVIAAMRKLPGARLLLTHSPDVAADLPPDFPLLLAGHTHCGQAVLPFYGALASVSRYGTRYECGLVREGKRTVVVTAGIGTSGPPLRLNAPPDYWVLTLGPKP